MILRAQPVGRRLQRRDVIDGEESVVVLAEADPCPLQLLLDEAVAVEIGGGLKREEGSHPQGHRSERLVADVEVIVGEAAALTRDDAVVRSLLGYLGRLTRKVGPCSMLLKMKYTP